MGPLLDRFLGWKKGLLLTLALLLAQSGAHPAEPQAQKYRLAVVPNLPAVALHKAWSPFIERLSKESGLLIELKLYDTFPAFLADCEQGLPDFLFTAPNLFFLAHQDQRYLPLVRGSARFSGLVFVRKDSPFQKLRELRGRTIAFVGPRNVCSVLTRKAMAEGEGPIEYNAMFSGTAINVAKIVQLGKADAGAMLDTAMAKEFLEQDLFRVLLRTEPIAPHPLAAHPRVPAGVRDAVIRAVFAIAGSESGKALLAGIRLADPVKADYKQDYAHFADPAYQRIQRPPPR